MEAVARRAGLAMRAGAFPSIHSTAPGHMTYVRTGLKKIYSQGFQFGKFFNNPFNHSPMHAYKYSNEFHIDGKYIHPSSQPSKIHASHIYFHGWTLIELTMVLAITAVLLNIAIPSFQDVLLRSKVSALSNEFVGDIRRARTEAIMRGACVVMCQSDDISKMTDASSVFPSCAASGDEWNHEPDLRKPRRGWIMFENPSCSSTERFSSVAKSLADGGLHEGHFIAAHQEGPAGLQLGTKTSATRRHIQFNARGIGNLSSAGTFAVSTSAGTELRIICVSSAGRTMVKAAGSSCVGSAAP